MADNRFQKTNKDIISIEEFKRKTIDERREFLVQYWDIKDSLNEDKSFRLVGTYEKSPHYDMKGQEYGFFINIRNRVGDILYYPFGLGPVKVWVKHRPSLETKEFWLIRLDLDKGKMGEKNPFCVRLVDNVFGQPNNSFRDKVEKETFIREIFNTTGYTERDALNEANALSRLMGDLYTETERFIFELLQNADDQPNETKRVNTTLKIVGDQLLFMHDGKPFDEDDVNSISSIGDSSKKLDSEKIGYKGIGFKSVFSDSETVFVNSGPFSFCFDKTADCYQDKEDMDKVPWQIKPIWAEKYRYPKDIQEDNLFFDSPVGIALTIPDNKIEDYKKLIPALLDEPRFILFLRNVTSIAYSENNGGEVIIKKTIDNNQCNIYVNEELSSGWRTSDFVLDVDSETKDLIENDKLVPQKLKEVSKTKITFAAMIKEGVIAPVPKDQSLLFTYLPTKVNSFEFPFLINADFLTTASREDIHYKNHWNIFLFREIGERIVDWVIQMADESENYLGLLPNKVLNAEEQDTSYKLVRAFNSSYLDALSKKAFIKDEQSIMRRQDEIIFDKTGLAWIIGEAAFTSLLQTEKKLPGKAIISDILKGKLFDKIEKVGIEDISSHLKNNLKAINDWLIGANAEEKTEFFSWIVKYKDDCGFIVDSLPILQFGNEWISVNEAIKDKKLIITEELLPQKDLLDRIGVDYSVNTINEHPLNGLTTKQSGQQVFQIICECGIPTTMEDKVSLLNLFNGFDDVTFEEITGLKYFHNALGEPTSMSLMVPFDPNAPEWLKPFMIAEEDNDPVVTKEFLVQAGEAFEKIILNNLERISADYSELYEYYKWSDAKDTEKIIDYLESKGELDKLIGFIESQSNEIKKYYLDSIDKIVLSEGTQYPKTTYEYRVLVLATDVLEDPSDFSEKVFVGKECINEYSIEKDVVCPDRLTGQDVSVPLSRLLPEYAEQSNRIDVLKGLFKASIRWEELIHAERKTVLWVKQQLDSRFHLGRLYAGQWQDEWQGNAIQYLFLVFSRRREWNNVYGFGIELENESEEFINEMMDFLFEHEIDVDHSFFTCKIKQYFQDKYFGTELVFANEELLPAIQKWADSEDKIEYLRENGVKGPEDNLIRFRQALIDNEITDAFDALSDLEKVISLDLFIQTDDIDWPITGENQIEYIKLIDGLKKSDVVFTIDYDKELLLSQSAEMNTPGYLQWKEDHFPRIYLYSGKMPKIAKAKESGTIIARFNDEDSVFVYDDEQHIEEGVLYINGAEDITGILRKLATDEDFEYFTEEDWNELFLIDRSTADKINKENEELKSKIAEYEKKINELSIFENQLPQELKEGIERGSVNREAQEEINKEARIKVKPYLRTKGYDVSAWTPETSSSDLVQIIKHPDGTPINVVVRSAKQGKIHLSASSFEVLMTNPNNLLIVENQSGLQCVDFKELFGTNSNVSLIFDATYTPIQYFQALAILFKYVKNTTFVVKDPNYSSRDEIKGFGLDLKNEGPVLIGTTKDI